MPRKGAPRGKPGDWMGKRKESEQKPASVTVPLAAFDYEKDIYRDLENPKTSALSEALRKISEGKAVVDDAILFCGRFNAQGELLRESKGKTKPYRLAHAHGHADYNKAMREAGKRWKAIESKTREGFTSSSDLGSTGELDPNQFTEFTPFFNGPFSKQQYFDYFVGHSRAFELYNHSPVAKRIIDIFVQYALGRGFKVRCKNDAISDKWDDFEKQNRIKHKVRKYWVREYLTYGENFIDKLRWISVDPSTIYDIICEGFGEYIDKVLYYYQMFTTATQMYAGIDVPGVPGSKDTKISHFVIRQIPYDQIIHIKTGVMSIEKRGRSVLYSVLGWLKKLDDLYTAQVLGEQLRASFVWDDTVDGGDDDVSAHAQKYNYIPVAPSIFVHNKVVERKALAPLSGVTGNGSNSIGNEILAVIATGMGIPKDHFNILMGGGSRATAIVGSEPFTKVIEDLQEDVNDLLHQIIETFCDQNAIDYDEEDWEIIFPAVVKDSTGDRLKNFALCEAVGAYSKRRMANKIAAEMEDDNYDYDQEQAQISADNKKYGPALPAAPTVPAGRFGNPVPSDTPADGEDAPQKPDNPTFGAGKKAIVSQHKNL